MDPNNPDLIGENVETPSASPAEMITPDPTDSVNSQGASNLSPEEVAWSDLKGGTQDRIKSILREKEEALARAERAERYAQNQFTPQSQPQPQYNPDVRDAVQKLSDVGMATKDEVRQLLNQELGNLAKDFELERLEGRHNGNDGFPKFDKTEYQDFINRNPQYRFYNPEDVYEKMYKDEIRDAEFKSYKQPKTRQSTTSSLRPTATQVREEGLTPEFIERRLQQPDGRKWYTENKERINTALASYQSSGE